MMEGIKHTLNCQIDQYGNLLVNMTELREIVKRYPNQNASKARCKAVSNCLDLDEEEGAL